MKISIIIKLITFSILPIIASCGLRDEPAHVKLAKCEQSAMYLEKNKKLMRDAVAWRESTSNIPGPMSRVEAIQYANERGSVIMMESMNGDGSLKKSVLVKWYESSYCKNLLNDYLNHEFGESSPKEKEFIEKNSDIEYPIMRQIIHYSKSLAGNGNNEVPCSKFNKQFEFVFDKRYAKDFGFELSEGIKSTIIDSSFKLKGFQRKFLLSEIDGDRMEEISNSLNSRCFVNDGFLSDKIQGLDIFPRYEPEEIIDESHLGGGI